MLAELNFGLGEDVIGEAAIGSIYLEDYGDGRRGEERSGEREREN